MTVLAFSTSAFLAACPPDTAEPPFLYMECRLAPPDGGFPRYASRFLHRSPDRKTWQTSDGHHHWVMDDHGYLIHVRTNFGSTQ